jgi:hypothetical protein
MDTTGIRDRRGDGARKKDHNCFCKFGGVFLVFLVFGWDDPTRRTKCKGGGGEDYMMYRRHCGKRGRSPMERYHDVVVGVEEFRVGWRRLDLRSNTAVLNDGYMNRWPVTEDGQSRKATGDGSEEVLKCMGYTGEEGEGHVQWSMR